ncbi:hypothetical protein EW146_g2665 [Bondarzewia mesenterica]|uniref:Transcription elongation factor SPT4 n=1 Tax=Bondarzewia mesenterica TaxID=1095465 RepID=A0A4S4M076_9AGAM|nr:hypothetical protein EW146_g2665 [Bondarzewia mesenterica]
MSNNPPNAAAIPPQARARQLRACLLCSIVQTPLDFRRMGCPNCEEVMQMKGSPDRIQVCTTTYFDGIIAIIDPETSWVSRWQRLCAFRFLNSLSSYRADCILFPLHFRVFFFSAKYVRGIYAVRVKGRVPEDVEAELESRGIKYRPRDQTDQD